MEKDIYYYNNPLTIQEDILSELENNLEGKYTIPDVNSTFGFLLDSFSTIVSNCSKGIELKFNSLYPKRAQSMEDLQNHISDFDYVNFQASPTSYSINVTVAKTHLLDKSVSFDDYYDALIIPSTSIFQVDNVFFSLYRDVIIKINKNTNNVLISYDTLEENPLSVLKNYDILFKTFSYSGVEYLSFELPIHQFKRQYINETVSSIGFIKKYKFEDKFYAIRMWDTINNFEFKYSFSDIIYDPDDPTCIIKVYQDNNELELQIPQIYFTNECISTKLKIEIYSTLGEVDISIDITNEESVKAEFKTNVDYSRPEYVEGLKTLETLFLRPVLPKIIGGKDNLSFSDIKNNVIYNLYTNEVPISNLSITNYFANDGFRIINQLDNITDRTYYAMRFVTDENSNNLSIVNADIILDKDKLDSYSDTIKYFSDGDIVILPKAILKYDKYKNNSIPLNNDELVIFNNDSALVDNINDNEYNKVIYHTLVKTIEVKPEAMSFDLMSLSVTNITFDKENVFMPFQASVSDAVITHLDNGNGGYRLTVGIQKSVELIEIPEEDFLVHMTIVTNEGNNVGKALTFESVYNDLYIYSVNLSTDYYLRKNEISLIDLDYIPGYTGRNFVAYTTNASISFYVRSDHAPTVEQDYDIYDETLIGIYHTSDMIGISKQNMDIKFGGLVTFVNNNISASYNPEQYERYEADIFATYDFDVYDRNDDGSLKFETDPVTNEVHLTILHNAGDYIKSTDNDSEKLDFLFDSLSDKKNHVLVQFETDYVIRHREGDIKYSVNNDPIKIEDRILSMAIDTIQLDLKYYYKEDFNLLYIYDLLQSYYDIVEVKAENLYGNTKCYFKPINTRGRGIFALSKNTSEELDLAITIDLKIYLLSYLISDITFISELENSIRDITKNALANDMFSLLDMSNEIKALFPDYIANIDILGINGDRDRQVLIKTSADKDLIMRQQLFIGENNKFDIKDDINIEYIGC